MEKEKSKFDLKIRTYTFALQVINFVDLMDTKESTKVISKQLLRSSTSVGANIIEGQSASSKKDFINFLTYSLKSANETKFWLNLLKDTKKGKQEEILELIQEIEEIAKILGASILTAKKKD